MQKGILIIDYGSQYTQLIARRIRELNVFCEIYPFNKISILLLKKIEPKGIILSGGPNSVLDKNSPQLENYLLDFKVPILGICYGLQLLSQKLDGLIKRSLSREYGFAKLKIINKSKIIPKEWFDKEITVWMSHGDHVAKKPKGFKIIAKSNNQNISIISNEKKRIYGLQFHPEVHHTFLGNKLLKNFVLNICKSKKNWMNDNFLKQKIKEIKVLVGNSCLWSVWWS